MAVAVARNVFFSFDYDDVFAVNIVRNSDVVRAENVKRPFSDRSLYEAAKNTPGAIKRAIDNAIDGTSVTVVVNGAATWSSYWVRYEIAKSFERGNGFIVVDINGVGLNPIASCGPNPLSFMGGIADAQTPATIDVYQADSAGKWSAFTSLPKVRNADAKYPHATIAGSYRLSERFPRHEHWKPLAMYFPSTIEAAAQEVGWPRSN